VRLLLFFALLSLQAHAQSISGLNEEQWVSARGFATVGMSARSSTQVFSGNSQSKIGGGTPQFFALDLSGVYFPRRFFGLGFGLRSDLLGASNETLPKSLPQQTVQGYVTAALRWQPSLLFGIEGHLGWWGGRAAVIRPTLTPTVEFPSLTGPVLGVTVVIDATTRFTAQLFGRLEASLAALRGLGFTFGAQARYGLFEVGPFDFGLAASVDINQTGREGQDIVRVNDNTLRFGIGPSLVSRRRATSLQGAVQTAPSVIGMVTGADGTPVSGATVSALGQTATSDATGAFALDGLSGPVTVVASAPSLRSASKEVIVTPGVSAEVTLVLEAKTGPGIIAGTVRAAPDKPLAGARVTSGAVTVLTSATGEFSLPSVGPGPVKVRVTLDGYAPADEVVQVAPEGTAVLDVTLEVPSQRTKAKLRGVVSSAAGPVTKATIRILELKLKQVVKTDGRFEVEVLGGKYTLVIEAAKHVTQTRVVDVADGDQAIFQIELEKVR
jgi:hypothetical protein